MLRPILGCSHIPALVSEALSFPLVFFLWLYTSTSIPTCCLYMKTSNTFNQTIDWFVMTFMVVQTVKLEVEII